MRGLLAILFDTMKHSHITTLILIYSLTLTFSQDVRLSLTVTLLSLLVGAIWFAYLAPINYELEAGDLLGFKLKGKSVLYQVLEVTPTKVKLSQPQVVREVTELDFGTEPGDWLSRRIVQYCIQLHVKMGDVVNE